MIIPLIGYAPDADPTARGVIVSCDKFVPTLRGMKGSADPVNRRIGPCRNVSRCGHTERLAQHNEDVSWKRYWSVRDIGDKR